MNSMKLQDTSLIHRNLPQFYTINKKSEKEIKEKPLITASKRIEYLGIEVPKGGKRSIL